MIADLAPAFPANTERLAAALSLHKGQNAAAIRCADLLEPDVLVGMVDRLISRFPEAGRPDLAVVWARRYCIRLLGGAVFPTFLLDRRLPVTLADTALIVEADTGFPAVFLLPHAGISFDTADPFERLAPLVRDHFDPFLTSIARHCKAPIKVLWGNAAVAADNLFKHARMIATEAGRVLASDPMLLAEATHWPDGWRNPLHEPFLPPTDGDARQVRKTCCLHYRLEPKSKLCASCPILAKQNRRATCVTDAA
ncbi:MAG: siderophore-iron reductase FhuF [Pseudochelatococcus sp.]|jgi:siderophore-iron reductase FhuF|uniref:siderophore-iron reductase FhuF n=1 Tax=Pseudochelatococcus sp. TaxID=2020869 RepID=UPI003D94EEB4